MLEFLKRRKFEDLANFSGAKVWKGNLSEMKEIPKNGNTRADVFPDTSAWIEHFKTKSKFKITNILFEEIFICNSVFQGSSKESEMKSRLNE